MLLNRLARRLRRKLDESVESGMDYWLVRATLRDGRVYSNVAIDGLYRLAYPDATPFRARDVVDVTAEGPRQGQSGLPRLEFDPAAPIR